MTKTTMPPAPVEPGWVCLRLLLALLIALHGWARWFAGGVQPFGTWLEAQGVPAGAALAALITAFEILATPMLALGVCVRPLALVLATIYAVGIWLVHWPHGWFVVGLGRNGAEYSVLLIGCLLLVARAHRAVARVSPGAILPGAGAMLLLALPAAPARADAGADAPVWQVVMASSSSGLRPPGVPAGILSHAEGEVGADGALSLRLSQPTLADTLWVSDAGVLVPIARLGAEGALGPGRGGAQAADRFSLLWFQDYGAGPAGRHFAALAGNSIGLWRHDGSRNVEVAREQTDGPLGPGLGVGWWLLGNSGLGNQAMGRLHLAAGTLLLTARVSGPEGNQRAILRRPVGAGWSLPCTLTGSADPVFAPGVFGEPDRFVALGDTSSGADAALYAYGTARALGVSPSRVGLWRFCEGAPQALALSNRRDALGPGLSAAPRAEFLRFEGVPAPLGAGAVIFEAVGRLDGEDSGSPLFRGLYRHAAGSNQQLALLDSTESGPGVPGWVFRAFGSSAGESHVALLAQLRALADGSVESGLWRIAAAGLPEPLAMTGVDGPLAPAPGQRWLAFDDAQALFNGDVLALARTLNLQTQQSEDGLWRFRAGQAPQRLIGVGDAVATRSAAGVDGVASLAALKRLQDAPGLRRSYPGDEGWLSTDGQVLLAGSLQDISGEVLIGTRRPLADRDRLLRDGFESLPPRG